MAVQPSISPAGAYPEHVAFVLESGQNLLRKHRDLPVGMGQCFINIKEKTANPLQILLTPHSALLLNLLPTRVPARNRDQASQAEALPEEVPLPLSA